MYLLRIILWIILGDTLQLALFGFVWYGTIVLWCILAPVNFYQHSFTHILNTLRPRQNVHHFTDNIFKCIFLNENVWISLQIWLEFVLEVRINDIPALVQIMTRHWPCDKPLFKPMMFSLLMHICVTRPQWVKGYFTGTGANIWSPVHMKHP